MTQPGWYPNGQNGLVQWWDGHQWHPGPPQLIEPASPSPMQSPLPSYQQDACAPTQQILVQPKPSAPPAHFDYAQQGQHGPYGYTHGYTPPPAQHGYGYPAVPAGNQFANSHGFGYPGVSPSPTQTGQRNRFSDLWSTNRASAIVVIVSLAYLLIDLAAGFTIFGIVPIAYSITAFRRKEKLAPIALACAVAIVVLGIVLHNGF